MISFEFEYYKPASVIEATTLFQSLDQAGKDPMYVSGATELITLGRVNQLKSGAIIDLKEFPHAFSGLCAFPFRDQTMEQWLNDHQLSTEQRIEKSIEQVPAPIVNDVHGSSEYRTFVLKNTLTDVLNELEGEGHV
ncbi:FAD binding domain-containing protein [Halalkalibacterium halodurans]|uniref:Molybdopterin dehydrogenase FAD-binding domain-containing protein n=2 Tax=Halalkalibacterium halodurans TaxID=86665 RepID=A0A0M0KKJ0_ALKHA|nr:FAD binding domain-containing protein [Halalkalibacterium halodurans]TPE67925.1 hypothetical protein AMD02_016335 [Halalkalibacterium halodurans]